MSMQNLRCWAALSLLVAMMGCSKGNQGSPEPLPMEQIPAVFQKEFAQAPADVLAGANRYVQSIKNHDLSGALAELRQLRAAPGLTSEQQTTLARAMITTTRELQTAADAGDQQSAQALHSYKISK